MITVYIDDESFSYDVHSLIKAFYPADEVKVTTDGAEPDISIVTGVDACLDRAAFKSELKRQLYKALADHTGKELPWGTLTGIRPTKLAMGCLDEGLDKEDAIRHMREYYLCSEEKSVLAADIALRERKIMGDIATRACASTASSDIKEKAADGSRDTVGIKQTLADGYSLYIGIPFCPTTCLYCSFMSYPIAAHRNAVDGYIEAVKKEIDYVAADFANRRLDSIYIGGGTPTTLTSDQLRSLIGHISASLDLSHIREFTVEAGRADSLDEDKLRTMLGLGVDRISVNPQTMNEQTLKLIGRRATAAETIEAYKLAREVGFENINMDIILGLPGEGMDDIKRTLDIISELRPDDLTVHALSVKRGSKLAEMLLEGRNAIGDAPVGMNAGTPDKNTGVKLRNDRIDFDEAMRLTQTAAEGMGLKPYYLYRQKNISGNLENTGYARDGRAGIYNILMMEEVQDIVALGAGTVSKHVYRGENWGRIERCDTHKDLKLYLENIDEMIDRKRRLFNGEQN